jgi:hypothetical protein
VGGATTGYGYGLAVWGQISCLFLGNSSGNQVHEGPQDTAGVLRAPISEFALFTFSFYLKEIETEFLFSCKSLISCPLTIIPLNFIEHRLLENVETMNPNVSNL